ncbi:hypothetical protein SELMODRAFT_422815 [Selaginella moellendorffii]|uniref:Uncharacterized protein n=1 Tax=Selaginella moellendorffii TaxID=88036 RepID=D8SJM7_SELML|nr:hypothetical protein SELMODRAFT_422815 [Selaginella moellendorffii]
MPLSRDDCMVFRDVKNIYDRTIGDIWKLHEDDSWRGNSYTNDSDTNATQNVGNETGQLHNSQWPLKGKTVMACDSQCLSIVASDQFLGQHAAGDGFKITNSTRAPSFVSLDRQRHFFIYIAHVGGEEQGFFSSLAVFSGNASLHGVLAISIRLEHDELEEFGITPRVCESSLSAVELCNYTIEFYDLSSGLRIRCNEQSASVKLSNLNGNSAQVTGLKGSFCGGNSATVMAPCYYCIITINVSPQRMVPGLVMVSGEGMLENEYFFRFSSEVLTKCPGFNVASDFAIGFNRQFFLFPTTCMYNSRSNLLMCPGCSASGTVGETLSPNQVIFQRNYASVYRTQCNRPNPYPIMIGGTTVLVPRACETNFTATPTRITCLC